MTAKKNHYRLLLLGAAAVTALAPYAADSGLCEHDAARNLLGAGYMDGILNASGGEDLEFLLSEGGVPNIMVLFDNSMSMRLLPPDGPGKIGGPTSTKPPTGIVGCGLDAISSGDTLWFDSGTVKGIRDRRFYPPCGHATNEGLVGAAYQGHAVDYAAAMTVCPYYTSSDSQATGAAGYDPNFYNGAGPTATTANGAPVFFAKDLVFHDAALNGTASFANPTGDGWSDTAVYPYKKSNTQLGSIADFCTAQGTTLQGTRTRADVCNECMSKEGWYYDGTQDSTGYMGTYPNLWYTGNYLSFFPPKFLSARKVVKDIIAVQSRVRMAMATFSGGGATVFQSFNPTCGMPDNSSFDSNRGSYISGLNNSGNLSFDEMTPLAVALFDIGRYYHSPDLPWFGAAWESSTKESASNANQYAVCFSCQTSSIIVLTDGVPNFNDGNSLKSGTVTQAKLDAGVYAGDVTTGITGIGKEVAPAVKLCDKECNGFSGTEDYLNNLPRVAWYLQNTDLRRNNETTLDCKSMGGVQRLNTYTVGFATAQNPYAKTVLENTAAAGKGAFVGAEDPSALKKGIEYIIQEISTRSTSFSVATISTLQTTAGRAVIVPRFDPSKSALWKGHLFRFDLYSEFVNDCVPGGAGDLDCDGQCVSTFLHDDSGSDKDVSLIGEDGNGAFVKNEPKEVPICASAPACATCAIPGNTSAVSFWDAGAKLATQSWKDRKVFTIVDNSANGRIDSDDKVIPLDTSDATADAIIPYLGLGTSPTGASVCNDIALRLEGAGDPATAAKVRDPLSKRDCAKTVVRFVLGADVFNEKKAVAPAWPMDPEALPDRDFKLGDIFHSSPQVVEPPFPRLGVMCKGGLTTQCKDGLWATPTPGGEKGYDGYALSKEFQFRDKIVLVGANDGLLHAFHGGKWIGNPTPGIHYDLADDEFTDKVDESLPPFNGYYSRGTAEELWAFVTPDMISKLPLLLGSKHQFFIDGDPWVHDVWVDGTDNGIAGATPPTVNDRKEAREFHTVAVVGERRGGTRFFALDVTSATVSGKAPRFLWIYPQPDDPESLTFGETYNTALPMPPPIVPLRIEATAVDSNDDTPEDTFVEGGVSKTLKYHERWVAWLNGGFDPQYLRGRGVHAVDVWYGTELFDFSYPLDPTKVSATDPRLNLRYPVPAPVGNMAWGSRWQQPSPAESEHKFLFDTATFGDAGGQTWVIRYLVPGRLGVDGRVTNWHGARAFQMGGQVPCMFCDSQPIFYITNNIRMGTKRTYRVGFGTGDRYNLLDKLGGTCGPDNIRACVMRGCTVTLDPASNRMEATKLGYADLGLSEVLCNPLVNSQATGATAACTLNGSAKITISACPGGASTIKNTAGACTEYADGYRCEVTSAIMGDKVAIDDSKNPITVGNIFASLLLFEQAGARKVFSSATEAASYDANRMWFKQTGPAAYTVTPGVVVRRFDDDSLGTPAAEDGPGWLLYYGHGPQVTVDVHVFNVDWRDERTSSTAGLGAGVMTWYSTQPSIGEVTASPTGGCRTSRCTAVNRRLSYHYAADPATGEPVLRNAAGDLVRSIADYRQVPPQGDQKTVFVNQQGQVAVGLTSVSPEKGATTVGMSEPMDPTSDVLFLEIDEDLHACRHADGTTTQPVCK